jgi:hypothetical protein
MTRSSVDEKPVPTCYALIGVAYVYMIGTSRGYMKR